MTLATIGDFTARHGPPDDEDQVEQLLVDATSLVRQVARQVISKVENDTVDLDGDGSRRLLLSEIPVLAVDSVTVDVDVLAEGDDYEWWAHGRLDRKHARWPRGPRTVEVVYDHGHDPVPAWVTNLVCGMVQRAIQPGARDGIRSEAIDTYQVSYTATNGVTVGLTEAECCQLETFRGPVFG